MDEFDRYRGFQSMSISEVWKRGVSTVSLIVKTHDIDRFMASSVSTRGNVEPLGWY